MDWSLSDIMLAFLPSIVWWFLGFIMPSFITLWWKIKKSLSWPAAIAVFMVCVAAGLIISNNIKIETPKYKTLRYLNSSGFNVRTIQDDTRKFSYFLTDNLGIEVNVFQLNDPDDSLIHISSIYYLPDEYIQLIKGMDEKKRSKIFSDLTIELLRLKINFNINIIKDIPNKSFKSHIIFGDTFAYSGDLTYLEFMDKILNIRMANAISQQFLKRLKYL